MAVVQFVSTAYAAKTMIDGISEGNLAKAIIGGVGAYMGMSSLATTAETSVLNAGESVAEKAADTVAGNVVSQNAGTAGMGGAKDVLGSFSMETSTGGATTRGLQAGVSLKAAPSMSGASAVGERLLNSPIQWQKPDDMLKYGALQLGGELLAGLAQQDWEEKMIADRNKREDEARERRGYWAPSPTVGKTRFNPRTGQFEEVAI